MAEAPLQDGNSRVDASVKGAVDSVKSTAATLAASAQESAAGVLNDAKERASQAAQSQMDAFADSIENFSTSLSGMSDNLGEDWAKPLAGHAADSLKSLAVYIRQADPDGVAHDALKLARERPGATMVGAVAIGFALARVGKAFIAQLPTNASSHAADTEVGQ